MSSDINFSNQNEEQLHIMAITFTQEYKKKMIDIYDMQEFRDNCEEPYIFKIDFPNTKTGSKVTIWVKRDIWYEFMELDDIITNINKQFKKLAEAKTPRIEEQKD